MSAVLGEALASAKPRWRVGAYLARTIYFGDAFVAAALDETLARAIVDAMNELGVVPGVRPGAPPAAPPPAAPAPASAEQVVLFQPEPAR